MDLRQFQKVFAQYLEGYSYAEIEKSVGVPKSTVQRWIQDFRNGEIGIYKEMLPYVDELATLGKFMRESGLELADIKSVAVIRSVIKSVGIGTDELINIGKVLKDVNAPEVVGEVSWTVTNLIGKGTKPSELHQKIDDMRREKDKKEEELAQINKNIETQTEAERTAEEKVRQKNENLIAVQKSLAEVRKDLESVRNETEERKRIIENAEKIDRFIQKNDIDLDQFNQFYSIARKHDFDIKKMSSLKDLEDFGLEDDTDTHEISDIVKSLDNLYRKGWDFQVIRQLDMATNNPNIRPADAVGDLLSYYRERKSIQNSLNALKEKERELKDNISLKTGEYNKLKEKCDGIIAEEKKTLEDKEYLENEISKLMRTKLFVESGITEIGQISSRISEKRSELKGIELEIQDAEETINGINTKIETERRKIEAAQEFYDLMKFGTPETIKSLKFRFDIALKNESGNMNQENTIERYHWARNTAIKLLLEIAGDGIGGIRYLNTEGLRFIGGKEYDDLVSIRNKLRELKETESKIKSNLTEIHKDLSKFISDAVAGRVKPTPEVDKLIVAITYKVITDQLKEEFEDAKIYDKAISKMYHHFDIQRILLKGLDRDSGLPVAGIVYPADFAEALKTGDHVKITNGTGGTNHIDLCTVMRQILLSRFNHDFYRLVQEGLTSGRMTDVRGGILAVVPGKQDEKTQQQFTHSDSMGKGVIPEKKDDKKGKEDKEGN